MGMSEANRLVKVVVEPTEQALPRPTKMTQEEWAQFVAETAGAWKGELGRPDQGVQ